MANVLRIAVVDPNDASREKLKSVLLQLDSVWLEAESSRYEFFSDVIEQTKADIGLIAMDADPARAIQLVAEVTAEHPQCTLLVTSSSTDGRLILESMRAGAKEFLTEPLKARRFDHRAESCQTTECRRKDYDCCWLPSYRCGWCNWRSRLDQCGREPSLCHCIR